MHQQLMFFSLYLVLSPAAPPLNLVWRADLSLPLLHWDGAPRPNVKAEAKGLLARLLQTQEFKGDVVQNETSLYHYVITVTTSNNEL